MLEQHEHVLVMSDDIYEHILHEGEFATLAQVAPALRDRILTVNGVSKAYSMTGWRLGYAAGPSWLIAEMEKLQSQSTSNPSSISQAATVAALRSKPEFLREWLDELKARRDEAVEILSTAPDLRCHASAAAFYLFTNCAGALGKRTPDGYEIATDTDLAKFLVDKAGVGTVAGQAFGASPFLRIAYAVPRDELRTACMQIVEACGLLR